MLATSALAQPIAAQDALELDSLSGDPERMVRDTVRRFVENRILPDVGAWFDAGTIPAELARPANNLQSVLTYEGTTEVHTLILGEAITGSRAIA